MDEIDQTPNERARIYRKNERRTRSTSSSSSTQENDGVARKRKISKQSSITIRSVTCVECGKPASEEETNFAYFTWTEKYFHAAEHHMFRKFYCPYKPCSEKCSTVTKLNGHIDETHTGSKHLAEPRGYHESVVDKVKSCFPVIKWRDNLAWSKQKRKSRNSEDEVMKFIDDYDEQTNNDVPELPAKVTSYQRNKTEPSDSICQSSKKSSNNNDEPSGISAIEVITDPESAASTPIQPLVSPWKYIHDPNVLLASSSGHRSFPSYEMEPIVDPEPDEITIIAELCPKANTEPSKRIELVHLDEPDQPDQSNLQIDEGEPFLTFPGYEFNLETNNDEKPAKIYTTKRDEDDDDDDDEDAFLKFPK